MKTTTNTPNVHPFKIARRAAVPIMAIETADPAATIRNCGLARNGTPDAFLAWDCVRGCVALPGKSAKEAKAIEELLGGPAQTQNLPACLDALRANAPQNCTVFLLNAHAALGDPTALQAIWNCRDDLKSAGSSIVLMGPSLKLPPELSNDVPLFEEPTPTTEDIFAQLDQAIKDGQKASEKFNTPTDEERELIRKTLTGYLSMYAVEQALALASTPTGINIRRLWDLKVANLKNTSGLEISQPEINFTDLAGCYGSKDFFGKIIKGRQPIGGVFFLDEIEKMIAGNGGDTSGTSQALVEQFLYWTEARKVLAVLLLGVPGAGKSHTAACVAGQAKVPLLRGSMSTVKGSLVGQSEQNMRNLLKTVDAVTEGKTLMIATCNSLNSLTPEILARFKLGVFFYDYPTQEEAGALWELYRTRYEIKDPVPGDCVKWVGREIESCCHRAWLFNCPLNEAAASVVPVSRANAASMEALRSSAHDKFLSASTIGIYKKDAKPVPAASSTSRNLDFGA